MFQRRRALIAGYKPSPERRLLKISKILVQYDMLVPLEVGQYLFPKVWDERLYAVISEATGHIDLLLDEGFVMTREVSGVVYSELLGIPGPGAVFKPVMY